MDAYDGAIWPVVKAGSQVGVNLINLSRLISYDMIRDPEQRKQMVDFIVNLEHPFIWQNGTSEPLEISVSFLTDH